MTIGMSQRRRLRDGSFLQATILATLDHLGGSATCNQLADTIGVGLGRAIRACDQLAGTGYLEKEGWSVWLTGKARASMARRVPIGFQVPAKTRKRAA